MQDEKPPKPGQVAAIIVAAGNSQRMQGINKTWVPLCGQPVLARSVGAFERSPLIDRLVLVLAEEALAQGQQLQAEAGWRKVAAMVPGGARRRDSVRAGLEALATSTPPQYVVIHDGARPLVTLELIERGLAAARQHGAAIAAVPVKDTIKRAGSEGLVVETLDRAALWAVQTPQVFAFDLLLNAHRSVDPAWDASDDAALLERLGQPVSLFMGLYDNLKVTTPEDMVVAEALLMKRATAHWQSN